MDVGIVDVEGIDVGMMWLCLCWLGCRVGCNLEL